MNLSILTWPDQALVATVASSSPSTGQGDMGDVIIWLVVLMLLVGIGGFIIVAVRRRLSDDPGSGSPSFNIASLRAMHAKGELTEEEFRKACEHLRQDVSGGQPTQREDAQHPS